ncbi:KIN4A [Symbiodinium sp. CCMP2592]|nr:KIN4A [Symbiodinium sp. CCMP2592]
MCEVAKWLASPSGHGAFWLPHPMQAFASKKEGQDESLDANKLVFLDEEDYVRLFRTELQEQERRAILRRKRCFLPFDDCVKWVRAMGLWDNQEEWEEWIQMGEKRNPYIPSRPDQYYGELGQWKGWAYFLGAPGTERSFFFAFAFAHRFKRLVGSGIHGATETGYCPVLLPCEVEQAVLPPMGNKFMMFAWASWPSANADDAAKDVKVAVFVDLLAAGANRVGNRFDLVFETDASQAAVYDGCVSSLLDGCMQGYNATVFAYGQTGSGKTYTMGTGQWAPEGSAEEGIVPKVIRNSFRHIEANSSAIDFKVSCCYLEIYNEDIRDLLQPGGHKGPIAIREDAAGGIKVSGIHAETCTSAEEMFRCLSDGSVQRTTGATLMNEQSSRSHSIFTLILEQRRRIGGGDAWSEEDYVTAKFHLVDLAGSERAKRTGAVGSRFKESISINSGLLALGNVISALGDPAKRGSHVPYRESKLTRLLQDSLGGNSRTVMIACVSCADIDFEETLNTLKYAHRARNIKNKPVINHDPRTAQLAAMQDEIVALREQLQRANEGSSAAGGPADEVLELNHKLEVSETRSSELAERLAATETEREAFRKYLVDVYSVVCQHLPAIWQVPTREAPTAPGRRALAAVCQVLQATHRLLNSEADLPVDETHASSDVPDASRLPAPPCHLIQERAPELTSGDSINGVPSLSNTAPQLGGEPNKLQSLSEMRKDSTTLIRKYLDEMKRLEQELALYRRGNKQLKEELKEAKDDLQKDEEIFEEKMREMKELTERNAFLEEMHRESKPLSPDSRAGSKDGPNAFAIQLSELDDGPGLSSTSPATPVPGPEDAEVDMSKPCDLEDTRTSQQHLREQMQSLSQNVLLKEDLIEELTRSEREWGIARQQYQARMEQLQSELEETQRQLDTVKVRLQESEKLEEKARLSSEEEKRRLERQVNEQMDALKRKQQEYSRLKDLRLNERKRVKDLEVEVAQMRQSQEVLDRRLQAERRREAHQIAELQRRLTREGQKVKDLEAKVGHTKRPATPAALSRKNSGGVDRPGSGSRGYAPTSGSESVTERSTPGNGNATSSSSRWQHLEHQLDEHIRILEATQGLEEDLRKQDALQRKREQYMNYRRKIAAKDLSEQQEATERMAQLEAEAARHEHDLHDPSALSDAASRARVEHRRHAIKEEQAELQRNVQRKHAEGLSILHDIDERLEGLNDELDFRKDRISKVQQYLRSTAAGAGQLDAELERIPAEDGKELLRRYCEKLVKLRQREKQHWQRLEAAEAQLEERARQIAELQTVLRRQDSNATKAIARVTKEYEARIRQLLRQLSAQQSDSRSDEPSFASASGDVEEVG